MSFDRCRKDPAGSAVGEGEGSSDRAKGGVSHQPALASLRMVSTLLSPKLDEVAFPARKISIAGTTMPHSNIWIVEFSPELLTKAVHFREAQELGDRDVDNFPEVIYCVF